MGCLLRREWRGRQPIIVFLMILSDDCASCPYEEDADYDRECEVEYECGQSPLLPSTHMSSANEANEVNPPQKPVISMTFSPGVMTCAFSNRPKRSPITKQPIMFTRNVPIGNAP